MYILLLVGLFLTNSLGVPLLRSDVPRNEPSSELESNDTTVHTLGITRNNIPIHIMPRSYTVTITPNFEESTFEGELHLTFGVNIKENHIFLNAEDLEIDDIVLTSDYSNTEFVTEFEYNEQEHFLRININEGLQAIGRYDLSITYHGKLRDDGVGLFKESYIFNGETRWYAATNFFPQHAKKVFPCIEHMTPTHFKLKAVVPNGFNAISNTKAVISNVADSNLVMYEFDTTYDPIPIYRFGFIISQMERIGASPRPIPVTIFGRKVVNGNGDFAAIEAQIILAKLEDYTDRKYRDFMENTDIDLVGMPTKFHTFESDGFTGTWEQYLTYDPLRSSSRHHQELVLAITKQLSSQWWGCLVSERDYIHAWLLDALRTFFQYHIGNEVERNLGLIEQFNNEVLHEVLRKDSNENSKAVAIQDTTTDPDESLKRELNGLKGAAVFQMVLHLMEQEHFHTAHRNFLRTKNIEQITAIDLYIYFHAVIVEHNLFEDYNGLTIENFMNSWLEKPGYPLVTISLDDMQNAIAKQERYFDNANAASEDTYAVPITWTRKQNSDFDSLKPKMILRDEPMTLEEGLFEEDEWILANVQQTGLYRVNYAEELWHRIIQAMQDENDRNDIHKLNRAQLIDDSLNLARSGVIPFDIALSLAETLKFEDDYVVWDAAIDDFKYLISRASGVQRQANRLRSFLRAQSVEFLKRIQYDEGLDSDNHLESLAMTTAMEIACSTDDPECIRRALQQYGNLDEVPPNLHSAVYCTAVREIGDEAFDSILERYQEEDLYSEQIVILRALGCSRDPEVVQRYLDLSVDDRSPIPINDRWIVFDSVVSEFGDNVDVALDFLNQNARNIWDIYGSFNNVAQVMSSLIEHIHATSQVDRLIVIVNNGGLSDAMPENWLSIARGHVQFGANYNDDIEDWLAERGYSSSGMITSSVTLVASLLFALFYSRQ